MSFGLFWPVCPVSPVSTRCGGCADAGRVARCSPRVPKVGRLLIGRVVKSKLILRGTVMAAVAPLCLVTALTPTAHAEVSETVAAPAAVVEWEEVALASPSPTQPVRVIQPVFDTAGNVDVTATVALLEADMRSAAADHDLTSTQQQSMLAMLPAVATELAAVEEIMEPSGEGDGSDGMSGATIGLDSAGVDGWVQCSYTHRLGYLKTKYKYIGWPAFARMRLLTEWSCRSSLSNGLSACVNANGIAIGTPHGSFGVGTADPGTYCATTTRVDQSGPRPNVGAAQSVAITNMGELIWTLPWIYTV